MEAMQLDEWILSRLASANKCSAVVLRDPQRMIHQNAYVVDGWGEENGYTVLLCRGNLGLREMYEPLRNDANVRVLLVDQSREGAKSPLFYPDLAAAAAGGQVTLTVRDFLVETTGDPRWPALVNERRVSEIVLKDIPGTLDAYRQLQYSGAGHFSDSDLYRIILGAVLKINPFRQLAPTEIRRLCVERHEAIETLKGLLPSTVMERLTQMIASAPRPFCWLLERDPGQIMIAFTLAAIMHQHSLEYQILLSNIDPTLHEYHDIDTGVLGQAMHDQLAADPDVVLQDVRAAEDFLCAQPQRLAFLLRDRLGVDDPVRARAVLIGEKLSPMVRSLALLSLLLDLIQNKKLDFHRDVLAMLDRQNNEGLPAVRRPPEQWQTLERAYRRALNVYDLTDQMVTIVKRLSSVDAKTLNFLDFDRLWNEQRINRAEYYLSDLARLLRVGDILPTRKDALWPELAARLEAARASLKKTVEAVPAVQAKIDTLFQDLYSQHYAHWVQEYNAPVVFTHQFLARLFKAHWDVQGPRKAVIIVFDGLRPDAWEELVRPVFEERFQIIESRAGSSLIPSETQLSRKAIAAGDLPSQFSSQDELKLLQAWLRQNLGLAPSFQRIVDDDTLASGMTVRYISERIEYIVFSFTDKNLHNNPQDLAFIYSTTVGAIIRQDVRSILRDLPESAMIFITSDHGFAEMPADSVTIPVGLAANVNDVRYRYAQTLLKPDATLDPKVVRFDLADLCTERDPKPGQKPRGFMLFPRPGYTFRRASDNRQPDRYSHGGISLAECMVPMVVMGPKQAQQQLMALQSMRQLGVAAEGEDAIVEVTIQPLRGGLPDTAITVSFSETNIPTRRDIVSGTPLTLTIRWQPVLDVQPADRERGSISLPLAVTVSYVSGKDTIRLSKSCDVRIRLNPDRLRRRTDSKLDLMMGKRPQD